jgi:hypothetical protein
MGLENPYKNSSKTWCAATVTKILKSEVYLGCIVQSKKAVKSFKTKQVQSLPPEMWIVVENTHEPLIDKETWSAVQMLFKANKNAKPRKAGYDNEYSLFANIVFCKECGSRIVSGSTKRATHTDYFYRCGRYVQHGTIECTPHRIGQSQLNALVLEDIKYNARLAEADLDLFIQKLHSISVKEQIAEVDRMKKRRVKVQNRLDEVIVLIQKSFEKNVEGLLSDDLFSKILQRYEDEKGELDNELAELKNKMLEMEGQTRNIAHEVDKLMEYAEITELTRDVVSSLINSIHISEPRKVDGQKIYDIEIRYKFHSPHHSASKPA